MYSWRVPINVRGKLEISAIYDLGGLGAREGPPTVYDWPAAPHRTWLFFVLMIGLVLVPSRNRSLTAFLAVVPSIVLSFVQPREWDMFVRLPEKLPFFVAACQASGLGGLLLLLPCRDARQTFAGMAVRYLAIQVGAGAVLAFVGLFEDLTLPVLVSHCLVSLAILCALASSVSRARSAHKRSVFVMCALPMTAIFVAVVVFAAMLIVNLLTPSELGLWLVSVIMTLCAAVGACLAGVIAAAILGYYLLLALKVPVFRERLDALLKLAPPPLPPVDGGQGRGSGCDLP